MTGREGVDRDAAVQLGQVDVAAAAQDVAEQRHCGFDVLPGGDARGDVPVLEAAAAAAVDDEPLVHDRRHCSGRDRVDSRAVRSRDVDAIVELEGAGTAQQRPLRRRAREDRAGIAEVAADRVGTVERLDRPPVRIRGVRRGLRRPGARRAACDGECRGCDDDRQRLHRCTCPSVTVKSRRATVRFARVSVAATSSRYEPSAGFQTCAR